MISSGGLCYVEFISTYFCCVLVWSCYIMYIYNMIFLLWQIIFPDILRGSCTSTGARFSTLRPRQNGRRFPDDSFKCIFLNENAWISIKISLKFVPKGPMNNIPALVQIMAWLRPGDKPLSEPIMISLLTHICVTRLQWVNPALVLCTLDHCLVDKVLFGTS